MNTAPKKVSPAQAWEEAERRSAAIGVAGWAVIAALQAAGVIPIIYRPWLVPASGLVTAFLTALTLWLAYYHKCWSFGIYGSALTLLLPFSVNVLWVRFSGRSLIYPLVSLGLIGAISLWTIHYRISGPHFEDDAEEKTLQEMMEEIEPLPWVNRVLLLWIIVGIVALFVVQVIR
jgi:hypothetical protein